MSRSTFVTNLAFQNSVRVFGVVQRRQPEWRCQKQPCTKTTVERRGKTMSGVPGRSRRWRRNLSPMACAV